MAITKDALKDILDSFSGSLDQKTIDLFKKLVDEEMNKDLETIDDVHSKLIYPFQKLLRGLVLSKGWKREVEFLIIHSRFVELHFQRIIQRAEGSACCADKSRTIIGRLALFLSKGEEIQWNYEDEWSFAYPSKVFTTHESIVKFYKALERLHFGYADLYLLELQSILKSQDPTVRD